MAKLGQNLSKTCQTCFKAKIKCQTSQSSRSCDRCSRLGKTCIFAPSRRQTALAISGSRSHVVPSPSPTPTPTFTSEEPRDPFTAGLLGIEKAKDLLQRFRSIMTPRFPFVVLPDADADADVDGEHETTLEFLRRERPSLCLAVLAVSSSDDFVLQRELSRLFNESIANGIITGKIRSLDMLQALLVHSAWTHYQPRPRSYSQHLHLATSIASDLRLDRPRNPQLWKVHLGPDDETRSSEWGPDERRALAGAYYLASSSSVVLQKMRHFPFVPFILESCEKLALEGDAPGDKHIPHIIRMQRLAEELDDLVAGLDSQAPSSYSRLDLVRHKVDSLKLELTFPLGECPTLLLQLGMLELAASQHSLPGSPLAIGFEHEAQITGLFSDSVLAAKSLLDILITMAPGQEKALTNLEWISLSYAMSFSARLDVLMADPRIAHLTSQARRRLGFQYTVRQVILRLRSIITPGTDRSGDCDTFSHFLRRAETVEVWSSRQVQSPSAPSDVVATPSSREPAVAEREAVPLGDGTSESTNLFAMDFFTEMQGTGPWTPHLSDNFDMPWGA